LLEVEAVCETIPRARLGDDYGLQISTDRGHSHRVVEGRPLPTGRGLLGDEDKVSTRPQESLVVGVKPAAFALEGLLVKEDA